MLFSNPFSGLKLPLMLLGSAAIIFSLGYALRPVAQIIDELNDSGSDSSSDSSSDNSFDNSDDIFSHTTQNKD